MKSLQKYSKFIFKSPLTPSPPFLVEVFWMAVEQASIHAAYLNLLDQIKGSQPTLIFKGKGMTSLETQIWVTQIIG